MKASTIFIIVVSVAALGVAGFFAYQHFKKPSVPDDRETAGPGSGTLMTPGGGNRPFPNLATLAVTTTHTASK